MSIDLTKQIASINQGDILRLKLTEENTDENSLSLIESQLEKPENIFFLEIDFPFEKVPDFIAKCTSLYEANLSGLNSYEGIQNLAAISKLFIFDYYDTLEKLPDNFGKLSQLRSFYLSAPTLKQIPKTLGSCKFLESIILSDCSNLQSLPDTIGSLINLRNLEITNAPLKILSPGVLKLVNLESLSLDDCSLQEIPAGIEQLKKLESLSFDDNLIQKRPAFLENMEQLFYISYEGNPFDS